IDLKRSKSQSLDEENGPSPPLHKKQGFSNSLVHAGFLPFPTNRTHPMSSRKERVNQKLRMPPSPVAGFAGRT
ncbi:MAG: hypothetical protein E6230_20450, partial [Paenibacillus dendritiformis]|nr:hypothetical protein [Paenibacillus dendritiformis]